MALADVIESMLDFWGPSPGMRACIFLPARASDSRLSWPVLAIKVFADGSLGYRRPRDYHRSMSAPIHGYDGRGISRLCRCLGGLIGVPAVSDQQGRPHLLCACCAVVNRGANVLGA